MAARSSKCGSLLSKRRAHRRFERVRDMRLSLCSLAVAKRGSHHSMNVSSPQCSENRISNGSRACLSGEPFAPSPPRKASQRSRAHARAVEPGAPKRPRRRSRLAFSRASERACERPRPRTAARAVHARTSPYTSVHVNTKPLKPSNRPPAHISLPGR